MARKEKWRRAAIWSRVHEFHALTQLNVTSPIISLVIGSESAALSASRCHSFLILVVFNVTHARDVVQAHASIRFSYNSNQTTYSSSQLLQVFIIILCTINIFWQTFPQFYIRDRLILGFTDLQVAYYPECCSYFWGCQKACSCSIPLVYIPNCWSQCSNSFEALKDSTVLLCGKTSWDFRFWGFSYRYGGLRSRETQQHWKIASQELHVSDYWCLHDSNGRVADTCHCSYGSSY